MIAKDETGRPAIDGKKEIAAKKRKRRKKTNEKERARKMNTADVFALCDRVRETAYAIHQYFGPGHLEKVYENALKHRLTKQGIRAMSQLPLSVRDEDGTVGGEYFADLFVEDFLIVEIKAAKVISDEHVAQMIGYLRASRQPHGLLINFGARRFQIKKYVYSGGDSPDEEFVLDRP